MNTTRVALAIFFLIASVVAHGQEVAPADSTDVHYFDAWPGVWHRVVNTCAAVVLYKN